MQIGMSSALLILVAVLLLCCTGVHGAQPPQRLALAHGRGGRPEQCLAVHLLLLSTAW